MAKGSKLFSNKTYDVAKAIAQIYLPALGTLYFTLAHIWGLPSAEQVVGSIVAIDTALGVVLGISTQQYNNSTESKDGYLGTTGVDPDTGIPNLKLVITSPPEEILSQNTVRLKVGLPDGQTSSS